MTEVEERPRELECVRKGLWRGRRYFYAVTGSGASDGFAEIGANWPAAMPEGEEKPKGARVKVLRHPENKKKFDLVVVDYMTSLIGKGLVYIDETMRPFRMTHGTTASYPVIEGLDTYANFDGGRDIYEWMVTKGTNVVNESQYSLIIRTAYTAATLPGIVDKMRQLTGRSYNSGAFTDFMNVGAKTLLWKGSRRIYDRSDEYTVIFKLAWNKNGWHTACESSAGVWAPGDTRILDKNGTKTEKTTAVLGFYPGYYLDVNGDLDVIDTESTPKSPVVHDLYEPGDMSFIDNLEMVN